MRTIDVQAEAVRVNSQFGSVIVEPGRSGVKVRVIADAGSEVELEPPYPLTGYGVTMRIGGKR